MFYNLLPIKFLHSVLFLQAVSTLWTQVYRIKTWEEEHCRWKPAFVKRLTAHPSLTTLIPWWLLLEQKDEDVNFRCWMQGENCVFTQMQKLRHSCDTEPKVAYIYTYFLYFKVPLHKDLWISVVPGFLLQVSKKGTFLIRSC